MFVTAICRREEILGAGVVIESFTQNMLSGHRRERWQSQKVLRKGALKAGGIVTEALTEENRSTPSVGSFQGHSLQREVRHYLKNNSV